MPNISTTTKPIVPALILPQDQRPETPPGRAPRATFDRSDGFEARPHYQDIEVPESLTVYAYFNPESAKQFCQDPVCLTIMQEIAQKNREPLKGPCYQFSRGPETYSLEQALQALYLPGGGVIVSTSN